MPSKEAYAYAQNLGLSSNRSVLEAARRYDQRAEAKRQREAEEERIAELKQKEQEELAELERRQRTPGTREYNELHMKKHGVPPDPYGTNDRLVRHWDQQQK